MCVQNMRIFVIKLEVRRKGKCFIPFSWKKMAKKKDLTRVNNLCSVCACYMVLTTPLIPGKLLGFGSFLPGPWKTPGKEITFLYSLKTPGILWKLFLSVLHTNQNLQKHQTRDCFCLLCSLDFSCCQCDRNCLISICFCREIIWILVHEKIFFLPWRIPGGFLSSVSEYL